MSPLQDGMRDHAIRLLNLRLADCCPGVLQCGARAVLVRPDGGRRSSPWETAPGPAPVWRTRPAAATNLLPSHRSDALWTRGLGSKYLLTQGEGRASSWVRMTSQVLSRPPALATQQQQQAGTLSSQDQDKLIESVYRISSEIIQHKWLHRQK